MCFSRCRKLTEVLELDPGADVLSVDQHFHETNKDVSQYHFCLCPSMLWAVDPKQLQFLVLDNESQDSMKQNLELGLNMFLFKCGVNDTDERIKLKK